MAGTFPSEVKNIHRGSVDAAWLVQDGYGDELFVHFSALRNCRYLVAGDRVTSAGLAEAAARRDPCIALPGTTSAGTTSRGTTRRSGRPASTRWQRKE